MIESLKNQIQNLNNYDGFGANSKCYCIGDYALLYGNIELDTIDLRKKLIDKYIAAGIQIAPILEFQLDSNAKRIQHQKDPNMEMTAENQMLKNGNTYQKGWILQQRATGSELHRLNMPKQVDITSFENIDSQLIEYMNNLNEYFVVLNKIANIPQEHLDIFIRDYLALQGNAELMVDPAKAENFFYDEQKGFTFIDVNIQPEKVNNKYITPEQTSESIIQLLTPLLPSLTFFQQNYKKQGLWEQRNDMIPKNIHAVIFKSFDKIVDKLRVGFANNNVDRNFIEEVIDQRLGSILYIRDEPQFNDLNELFEAIKIKLNTIIATNMQNGIVSDEELKTVDNEFMTEERKR